MTDSFGYGPTRNLTPARMHNLQLDSNALNITDAIPRLGASLLARHPALHESLLEKNANLFGTWDQFVAAMGDMNGMYGVGGGSGLADGLYAAATPIQETALNQYNMAGMTDQQVLAILLALITFRGGVQNSWSKNMEGNGGVNLALFPSGGGLPVYTPHAASVFTVQGITDDIAAIDGWFLDLALTIMGNIGIVSPG